MGELPSSPTTLLDAVATFADKQVAHDYFVAVRWPNGIACPRQGCGSAGVAAIANRNAWRCRECDRQFTAKVGTVFEDSPIGFDKWLPAMWMLSACRNGVSSCEIARHLNVTQKTAWFMLHRLRLAMKTETFEKLAGEVEADETFVGGKTRRSIPKAVRTGNRKDGDRVKPKTVVMGLREGGGRVRAFVVANNRRGTLMPRIREHVTPGATLYTDSLGSYREARQDYEHLAVDHAKRYVDGKVHTNNIENFWSVLKRTPGRHLHLP
jgi:transposase-like protein